MHTALSHRQPRIQAVCMQQAVSCSSLPYSQLSTFLVTLRHALQTHTARQTSAAPSRRVRRPADKGGPAREVSERWGLGIHQSRDRDSCPRGGAQTEAARGQEAGTDAERWIRVCRERYGRGHPQKQVHNTPQGRHRDRDTEKSTTVPPPSLTGRPRDRDTRRNTSAHTLGAHPVPRELIFTEGDHGVSASLNFVHFLFRLQAP